MSDPTVPQATGAGPAAGRAMPSQAQLAAIQLVLFDVDGVLTDGRIWFDADGHEYKSFHVQDAAGIVYWHRSGGLSGFLSGRGGTSVEKRAHDLGIHEVLLKRLDKATALAELLQRRALPASAVAYVGDDLLDLPVLERVGFAVTVPEGRDEVKARVHYVTRRAAGFGAAREVIELLLRARGVFDAIVSREGRA